MTIESECKAALTTVERDGRDSLADVKRQCRGTVADGVLSPPPGTAHSDFLATRG